MRIHVEFLGLSRLVIGKKAEEFELPEKATFRDLTRFLGEKYPGLIGNVIQPGQADLQAPNIFNLDGKRMIRRDQMDDKIDSNEHVILMSMSAGG